MLDLGRGEREIVNRHLVDPPVPVEAGRRTAAGGPDQHPVGRRLAHASGRAKAGQREQGFDQAERIGQKGGQEPGLHAKQVHLTQAGRALSGLAGSQAAGTFAAWGTPTVKFHQCRGALSGLMAALLAQQAFVATREFLTAKDGGLYNTYSNGGNPDAAVAGLGERWELEQIALRLWPSASTTQGLITAMFDLVEQHRIDPAQVRKVRVTVSKTANDMHGIFPRYKGKFDALLSAHYSVAAILHDRELTLAQFEPARYNDPKLKAFSADKVEVRDDPGVTGVQAIVEAEMADGRTVRVRSPSSSRSTTTGVLVERSRPR